MVFAHDTGLALQSAVWLVNSAQDPDTLTSTEQLAAFFVDNGYTGRLVGDRAELEDVRALRPTLRELLTSSRDEAVEIVNRLLRDGHALPQLVRHGQTDWHLHATDDDEPLATRI
ncbi:MAG: ABATE domain-containing protein, partial [Aeromicrobium sp.]